MLPTAYFSNLKQMVDHAFAVKHLFDCVTILLPSHEISTQVVTRCLTSYLHRTYGRHSSDIRFLPIGQRPFTSNSKSIKAALERFRDQLSTGANLTVFFDIEWSVIELKKTVTECFGEHALEKFVGVATRADVATGLFLAQKNSNLQDLISQVDAIIFPMPAVLASESLKLLPAHLARKLCYLPPKTDVMDSNSAWLPNAEDKAIAHFLSSHKKLSVTLVTFGSVPVAYEWLLQASIAALAEANCPLLVICPPSNEEVVKTVLKEQVRKINTNHKQTLGFVCHEWVSVVALIKHANVGRVLTHGGYSTLIEAIAHEKFPVVVGTTPGQCADAAVFQNHNCALLASPRDHTLANTSYATYHDVVAKALPLAAPTNHLASLEFMAKNIEAARKSGIEQVTKLLRGGNP